MQSTNLDASYMNLLTSNQNLGQSTMANDKINFSVNFKHQVSINIKFTKLKITAKSKVYTTPTVSKEMEGPSRKASITE